VEDLDDPALLGDEDPAVGRETDGGWLRQAAQGDRLLKAAGERRGSGRDGRERIDDGNGRQAVPRNGRQGDKEHEEGKRNSRGEWDEATGAVRGSGRSPRRPI